MSLESTPLLQQKVGVYCPAPRDSSRSPCPVVNALANHGYIDRGGRDIHASDLHASMRYVGLTHLFGGTLAKPPYLDYNEPKLAYLQKPIGFWTKLWRFIKNPYSMFWYLGCWLGKHDKKGNRVLDLETLGVHGAIEHDISLCRKDFAQDEGQIYAQGKLISQLLACSSDGGNTLTIDDFGTFVRQRIQQQLVDNPELVYSPYAHRSNSANVTMLLHAFGDGKSVPCKYIKALFQDERLPWDEGWRRRFWWPLGLIEFFRGSKNIRTQWGIEI